MVSYSGICAQSSFAKLLSTPGGSLDFPFSLLVTTARETAFNPPQPNICYYCCNSPLLIREFVSMDLVEPPLNILKLFSTDFRDRQESSDHHLVRWTVLIYRWGNSDTDRLHLLYVSKLNTNRVVVVVVVVLILFLLRLLSLLSCCLSSLLLLLLFCL